MILDIIKENRTTIYKVNFSSLTDIHDYLKSNPKINTNIFSGSLASMKDDRDFYGDSLDKAIEYCIQGYTYGLDNFLEANELLKETCRELSDSRQLVRGLYGGVPIAPLVAADVTDCMVRYEREENSNVRNIYYNVSCPWFTKSAQIRNMGLIALFIAGAFENRGEMVNFRVFELSRQGDELIDIEVVLKRPGDAVLDVGKCYYPLVSKEFLRRLLFRTLESMPVKNYWNNGYGQALDASGIRSYFGASENDIIFSHPKDMNITGNNIYDDTICAISSLNLTEEFDIEKIKKLKL